MTSRIQSLGARQDQAGGDIVGGGHLAAPEKLPPSRAPHHARPPLAHGQHPCSPIMYFCLHFGYLFVRLYLSTYLCIFLHIYVFIYLFMYSSAYLCIYLSTYLFIYLPIYVFNYRIYRPIYVLICVSALLDAAEQLPLSRAAHNARLPFAHGQHPYPPTFICQVLCIYLSGFM